MNNISAFIKYHRKKRGLTQENLASKAGVGIRFVRELEQGKETLQLDKIDQVLNLFGFRLTPQKLHIDPYDIFWNYLNKTVKITLTNKLIIYGSIITELIDKKENKITSWKFVPNHKAIKYQQKPDDKLCEIIAHADILKIENQS